MSYFGNKNNGEKIFRGAYKLLRNDTIYCEEEFEVFREKRDKNLTFVAEQISRVSTGELLTMATVYKVTKSYVPIVITTYRTLGTHTVIEEFQYDNSNTRVQYTFDNGKDKVIEFIPTPPYFTIATSSVVTSMIHLRSKKFEMSEKNFYSLLTSKNMWEYEELPTFKNIVMEKLTATVENLKIADKNHQAIHYKLIENVLNADDNKRKRGVIPEQVDEIRVWLSQHLTIPYLITDDKGGTRVEIKFLNNLGRD